MNELPLQHESISPGMRDKLADTAVLIPAAGRVSEGVLALSNIACPAMVPVAGRPVIHWTMKYLRSLGLRRFYIAVSRRGMFIEDFVECTVGGDSSVEFIVPSADGGVGRTVAELAGKAQGSSALVVLGDTHFQFADATVLQGERPTVLVAPVNESYRWCIAEVDSSGTVRALHDKQPGLSEPLDALIGVYYFPDLAELRRAADQAVETTPSGRGTDMSQILTLVSREQPVQAVRAGDWLDCGNPDRQASSHRVLLQKRDFNELTIDPVLGTITKRSRHTQKFIDEINYLRLLPPDLAVLFPRIVDFSTDWDDPWVKMEYYGYPTLADIFVFENVDPGIWERIFCQLRDIILTGFMRYRRPLALSDLVQMYVGKTRERLQSLKGPPELLELVGSQEPISVNGRRLRNLPAMWDDVAAAVERLWHEGQGAIVHGDLCLSNILFDIRSGVCKLLDPRGSFGSTGIYGDPRYDVAKLYHSVHGLYDLIINDLFHISVEGREVWLDIRARPQHVEIKERFEHMLLAHFPRDEILLLTGLLFASMPALHYDAPQRQLAMYIRGLQLLDEYFGT